MPLQCSYSSHPRPSPTRLAGLAMFAIRIFTSPPLPPKLIQVTTARSELPGRFSPLLLLLAFSLPAAADECTPINAPNVLHGGMPSWQPSLMNKTDVYACCQVAPVACPRTGDG
jgi:hypothetical protein